MRLYQDILIMVIGSVASGKSTLARKIAECLIAPNQKVVVFDDESLQDREKIISAISEGIAIACTTSTNKEKVI